MICHGVVLFDVVGDLLHFVCRFVLFYVCIVLVLLVVVIVYSVVAFRSMLVLFFSPLIEFDFLNAKVLRSVPVRPSSNVQMLMPFHPLSLCRHARKMAKCLCLFPPLSLCRHARNMAKCLCLSSVESV